MEISNELAKAGVAATGKDSIVADTRGSKAAVRDINHAFAEHTAVHGSDKESWRKSIAAAGKPGHGQHGHGPSHHSSSPDSHAHQHHEKPVLQGPISRATRQLDQKVGGPRRAGKNE